MAQMIILIAKKRKYFYFLKEGVLILHGKEER
jgi:hypothetical protein